MWSYNLFTVDTKLEDWNKNILTERLLWFMDIYFERKWNKIMQMFTIIQLYYYCYY